MLKSNPEFFQTSWKLKTVKNLSWTKEIQIADGELIKKIKVKSVFVVLIHVVDDDDTTL